VRNEIADIWPKQGRFGQKRPAGFLFYDGRAAKPDKGVEEAESSDGFGRMV